MNNDGMESTTGSPADSLCSRCGLSVGQRGSFTYWIFKEHRCQCDPYGVSEPGNVGGSNITSAPGNLARSHLTSAPGNVSQVVGIPAANLTQPGGAGFPEKKILNKRYELLECVGQGGVGFVYKGRDITNGQLVALKIMRPDLAKNELATKRVMREVEVVSRLSNSNLGQVYGYGQEQNGSPYLIMEFVEGKNLEEILKVEGKLKLARALEIFSQICSGLICAHTNGIIHRDLKPSNVIIQTTPNDQDRATIVDFGFARLLRDANDSVRLTQEGEVFGSPAYMSPEQCLGEELDVRSDIYSLGCLMYETLVGTPPLMGENVLATVAKQIRGVAASLTSHDITIPEDVDAIILKCLNKEPLLRYQAVNDLRVDLEKIKRGEHVKVPMKRSHNQSKSEKNSEDRRSLRSTESVYGKMTSMIGIVLLAALFIGGGSGVAVWLLMQKQGGAVYVAPPPAPPLAPASPGKTSAPVKRTAVHHASVVPHTSGGHGLEKMHNQAQSLARTTVHQTKEAHAFTRTSAISGHSSGSAHSPQHIVKSTSGWDDLKGLRRFK
jgi:serine/threonine protein kinase